MSRVVVYGDKWPVILDGTAPEIDPEGFLFIRMGAKVGAYPPYDELVYYDTNNGLYIVLEGSINGNTFEAYQVQFQSQYDPALFGLPGDIYLGYFIEPPLVVDPENPGDLSVNVIVPLMDGNDSIDGSNRDDRLYGYGGDDEITGWKGDDLLDGGNGNDVLSGYGGGSDTFIGGKGDDLIWVYPSFDPIERVKVYGGTGTDQLGFSSYAGIEVTFRSADSGNFSVLGWDGTKGATGTFGGIEIVIGGNGHDVMTGIWGSNTFYGHYGNDILSGGGGNDFLYGGDDQDTLNGNTGNDKLYGENGNDILDGGLGNDLIDGGRGNDILTGGDGSDRFYFDATSGNDVVTDFDPAEDTLLLGLPSRFASLVLSFGQQVGDDVVFYRGSQTVTLEGVQLTDLSVDNLDFI